MDKEEHVHDENCGCGHDHDHDHHDHEQMVTITLENDEELNCAILGNFEVGDQDYIALLPEGTEEVLIYRFVEDENGEVDLQNIESDEEFAKVSDGFNAFMDELEAEMEAAMQELDSLE